MLLITEREFIAFFVVIALKESFDSNAKMLVNSKAIIISSVV